MSTILPEWRAVQMGSEGWTVFGKRRSPGGYEFGMIIASNLTEEDAKLIASSHVMAAKLERMRQALLTLREDARGDYPGYADRSMIEKIDETLAWEPQP